MARQVHADASDKGDGVDITQPPDTTTELLRGSYDFVLGKDDQQVWAVPKEGVPAVLSLSDERSPGHTLRNDAVPRFRQFDLSLPKPMDWRFALDEIISDVRLKGQVGKVSLRVAAWGGAYYLDLGESGVVRVSDDGVQILTERKLLQALWFRRPNGFGPLSLQEQGNLKDIELLQGYLSLAGENSFILVIAWLLEALRPDTPYPVLFLTGAPGSAKSTSQRILKQLIDPVVANLTISPRHEQDLVSLCACQHVVSIDNAEALSPRMQNLLCGVATGTGAANSKAHDRSVQVVKNPVVINGLSAPGLKVDFLDRALIVPMAIPKSRKEVQEIEQRFQADRPKILAGLLQLMAQVLKALPEVTIPQGEEPRLIEYYRLGLATERVMDRSNWFSDAFKENRQTIMDQCISEDVVLDAIIDRFGKPSLPMQLKGTAQQLMEKLQLVATGVRNASVVTPRAFVESLKRNAGILQELGFDCYPNGRSNRGREWVIVNLNATSATTSITERKAA